MGGDNVPPLVEMVLTDMPKTGGAKALPPLATALLCYIVVLIKILGNV